MDTDIQRAVHTIKRGGEEAVAGAIKLLFAELADKGRQNLITDLLLVQSFPQPAPALPAPGQSFAEMWRMIEAIVGRHPPSGPLAQQQQAALHPDFIPPYSSPADDTGRDWPEVDTR